MTEMVPVEDELQRILKASGIESSPVDPSSMEFLRQLVQDRKQNKSSSSHKSTLGQQNVAERHSKTATATSASPPASAEESTNQDGGKPATTSSLSSSDTAMILEQLKMQTNLILSLQDKVQILTYKVNRLNKTGGVASSRNTSTTEPPPPQPQEEAEARSPRLRIFRREVRVVPPPAENVQAPPPQDDGAADPVAGPQELQPNVITWFFRTTRLFWTLSRDYVRPIDGTLLFKLVFMTMVVMARFSKYSRKNDKSKDPKILMVLAVLMMGFLFHTRYIQYVYQFLWKHNVPGRVWKGEQDISIPPPEQEDRDNWNGGNNFENNNNDQPPLQRNPVPPRLRRPDGGNNNEEQRAPWWQRNNFLVGGVAPIDNHDDDDHDDDEGGQERNPPAPVNPIVAVVQGIYFLLGSFVFSIFPMWNAQGHQQRRPLRQERLDGDADDGVRIPEVQPPRDAMEAADDESDDDDNEAEQQ